MNYEKAWKLGDWIPIRDCPGRFVLNGGPTTICVTGLLGNGMHIQKFQSDKAKDKVFVVEFDGGGTISYQNFANSWVHTLCDCAGFARKMKQLEPLHTCDNCIHKTEEF